MYEETDNTITITRGDSAAIHVTIYDGNEEYTPVEGDSVRFALKKHYDDPEPLLVIDIPISTMDLILVPEDTKNLDMGPVLGRYKYDIELTRHDGMVATFIRRADFIVLEEVL